jgi:hypothetical protein
VSAKSDPTKIETEIESPASDGIPRRVQHLVGLERAEVMDGLRGAAGVGVYERGSMPEFAGPDDAHDFTVETEETGFRVHCGPPAARGQSGTGLLALLYLRARLRGTSEGTEVDLRFSYGRPRWALQRRLGLLLTGSLGLVWVFIGQGEFFQRVLFFSTFAAVTIPVIAHDLSQGRRLRSQKLELLALMERVLGPFIIGDEGTRTPYRKRRALGQGTPDGAH